MAVTKLFIKTDHGAPLTQVDCIDFDERGIAGNVPCAPFRRVLLASRSVTADCGLCDGDVRENVVVDFKTILHRRGVFGAFLNEGRMCVGDALTVTGQKFEPIPYEIGKRIRWFVERHEVSGAAVDLAHAIGLPALARTALPGLFRKILLRKEFRRSRSQT